MVDQLTLERWERMRSSERENWARQLARELPEGFRFRGLQRYALGDQRREVAEFEHDGSAFVLVPGGTIRLGYDAERPWEPSEAERQSWEATAEEYEIGGSLREHIAAVTLPPRRVQLQPFLIETRASEPGWQQLAPDDPESLALVAQHGQDRTARRIELYQGGAHIRIERQPDGGLTIQRAEELTHEALRLELARAGWRLPTSDEWEYACGGGSSTLFRWGNHVPCERYPTDSSPEEAAWRRRWVLSGGKLEYPAEGFAASWDLHRRPNAFGLHIASNPYNFELVAEADITRGGDGGCTICGGAGFFVGWLTLATAYFEEHACLRDPDEPISSGYTVARRVLGLG